MAFQEIEFPKKGWRPVRDTDVSRALRGEKQKFTTAQQQQYDQLISTARSGMGVLIFAPHQAVREAGGKAPYSGDSISGLSASVRIRLMDKDGYVMESKRVDEDYVAVRLHEELLYCSTLGCRINAVEWQREHSGERLRRTDPCPFHRTSGVLLPRKKAAA